jgi:hypothetical protein
VVWSAATLAAVVLNAWLASLLLAVRPGVASGMAFEELLTAACAAAALGATCWLWLLATALVIEALGGRPRVPGAPAWLRRLVLAACGVAAAAGAVAPAQATPGDLHQDRTGPSAVVAGLPYPDRATALPGEGRLAFGPLRTHRPDTGRTVVVRAGDTLWSIAAAHLGAGDRWPEVYALNRGRIGADPDLIVPGLRLRLPVS